MRILGITGIEEVSYEWEALGCHLLCRARNGRRLREHYRTCLTFLFLFLTIPYTLGFC